MPNSNAAAMRPSHKKRNTLIAIIAVLLLIALGVGSYLLFFSPQAKTTALNNKLEDINTQLKAIPNLDTKENRDKFNKLVDEFLVARKQQEENLKKQLDTIK
jgi:uncharacterized protein HemX